MSDLNITTTDNGPFLVKGNAEILDAEGNAFSTKGNPIALCRCGHSGTQPFCNGSHKKADFKSAPRAS